MPSSLQLETLAQMLTVALKTLPGLKESVIHGLKHNARIKKEVLPDECFNIETETFSWKRGICIIKGVGYTNGVIYYSMGNSKISTILC